jgi:threonine-phosphate decarboxylase
MKPTNDGAVEHGGAPSGWLDLSVCLNPLGTPRPVARALAVAGYGAYAELEPGRAIARLARDSAVDPERILVTAGATEALRLVFSSLLPNSGRIVLLGPTYGEYRRLAEARGAEVTEIRAPPPTFKIEVSALLERIRATEPHMVVICHPNNPTGALLSTTAWRAVLTAVGDATVLVDESFAVFVADSLVPLEDERLVSVRSLTKLYATPGVRAGFLIAGPRRMERIRQTVDPWTVGSHALAAARAGGWGMTAAHHRQIALRRRALLEALNLPDVARAEGLPFVLVPVPQTTAVVGVLARAHIAVRSCASFGLPDYLRIGIPDSKGLRRLSNSLGSILVSFQ